MNNIIVISLSLINSWFFVRDFRQGIIVYLILCLVGPNIILLNQSISYEVFYGLIVFIFFFVWVKNNSVKFSVIHVLLLLYFVVLTGSTALSIMANSTSIEWIALLGSLRIIVLTILFSQFRIQNENMVERVFFVALCVNFVFSCIQILYPSSIMIFAQLYGKASLTPLLYYADVGLASRAIGSFGSPVNLGMFSLVCLAYFWGDFLRRKSKISIISLYLCFGCGILSCTKTFILGTPIIIVGGWLICLLFNKQIKFPRLKQLTYSLVILAGLVFVGERMYSFAISKKIPVDWYLSFLGKPLDALSSRYEASEGILKTTRLVIEDNILVGVGKTIVIGEFIGDSFYYVMLHDAGLIGAGLFLFLFIIAFRSVIKQKDVSKTLMLIVLVLGSFGIDLVFSVLGVIVLSYVHQAKQISVGRSEKARNYNK